MSPGILDPFNEMQFIVRLAAFPDEASRYPGAVDVVETPMYKAVLKAILKKKTGDLGVIANIVSQDMPNVTAQTLKADIFDYIGNVVSPSEIDVDSVYRQLSEHYMFRRGIPTIEKHLKDIESRRRSPLEAVQDMENELLTFGDIGDVEIVTTDDWDRLFSIEQADRAKRFADGNLPWYPEYLPVFHNKLGTMEDGVYVLLGDTGSGKTDIMHKGAEYLASYGHSVVFGSTEARWSQMARRTILRYADGGLSNSDLLQGKNSPNAIKALRRLRGVGKVIYPRMRHMKLKTLVSIARRNNAHLWVDLFHDCDLSEFRKQGQTYFDVLQSALDYVGDWAVNDKKVAWLSIQLSNMARMEVRRLGRMIYPMDANGGSAYESKTAGMFIDNTPKLVKDIRVKLPMAMGGGMVTLSKGTISQLAMIEMAKSRETIGGVRQYIFHDRARRDLVGYAEDEEATAKMYLDQIYSDIQEAKRGKL